MLNKFEFQHSFSFKFLEDLLHIETLGGGRLSNPKKPKKKQTQNGSDFMVGLGFFGFFKGFSAALRKVDLEGLN